MKERIRNYFKNKEIIEIIPWIWMIVAYILTFIVIYFKGRYYVDGDMSVEMRLADLLNEEGSLLVTSNWYYTSELRIFYLQIIYRLMILIFPNHWWVARVLGQAIWMLILLISYFFLCGTKGLNLNNKGVLGAACLACPFGLFYFWYGAFGGFYIPHMVLVLISLGLIVRTIKANDKKERIIYLLCLIGVSFLNGLGSVKGLMALYVPICLASFILIIYQLHEKNNKPRLEIKTFIISIIALLSSTIGYLINSKILINYFSGAGGHSRYWGVFEITNFLNRICEFLTLLGHQVPGEWYPNVNILSLYGLLGAFFFVTVFILVVSIVTLIKKFKKLDYISSLMITLFLSIILVQGFVFAFTNGTDSPNASYWLTPLPLVFVILQLGIDNFEFNYKYGKNVCTLLLLISISSTSIASVNTFFTQNYRAVPKMKGAYEFLIYNNLTQGYASYWHGNVLTEWSSGKIETWVTPFNESNFLAITDFGQRVSHEQHPEGEIFILLTKDEISENIGELLGNSNIVYSDDDGYCILVYENYEELIEAISKTNLKLSSSN